MPIISGGGGGGGAISGVTVTGAGAAGKVPVASSAAAGTWAFPPGYEVGYDQITATVTVASTTEATGTTIITCAAHVFDGAAVLVEFFTPQLTTGSTSGSFVAVSLFEGATQISELCSLKTTAASQAFAPGIGKLRFTPTAASHSYTVTAFASNVTGNPSVNAGATGTGANPPAYIRFTKV